MQANTLHDLLAALLPAPERDELIRRGAVPERWSLLFGLVEVFAGVPLLLSNALTSFQAIANDTVAYLVEQVRPEDFEKVKGAVISSGPLIWLAWALRPMTWLLASVCLTGVARLVTFGVSREAFGEPLVWLPLRLFQAFGRLRDNLLRRRRFGPLRPDRILLEPGSDLVVLSCRPKPDWNELVTIEVAGLFYRLHRVEERQDGRFWTYAHSLQEAPPHEVIRFLVRYDPPATAQRLLARRAGATPG